MNIIIFQRLLLEAFLDLIYFPVWWYTGGLKYATLRCLELLKDGNARLAPGLWFRYILVPMYGQYDIQGRIISFFMRLFNTIFRFAALIIWLAVCLWLILIWILIPVIIAWGFARAFA